MLILAGVSISALTGENGILKQAENAKEIAQKSNAIEQAKIDILAWKIEQKRNKQSTALSDDIIKNILKGKDYIKGEPGDTGFTTKEGNYIIKYSELYKGKTIAELYDGINNPSDEGYNQEAMHIGDWVNYTAGTWEEEIPTPTTKFTFGGYTEGQSRDENANGQYTGARESAIYEGWRIWDIDEENETITLISAGCPEEYRVEYYSYISQYILSGNVDGIPGGNSLSNAYTPRDWSAYKNTAQYANSARALTKSDLDTWYKEYIDTSIDDTYNVSSFPKRNENKLISTVDNQCFYWLASAYSDTTLYYVNPSGRNVYRYGTWPLGVRVLVSLESGVEFEETPQQIEKDGFTYNKWIIKSK